MKKILSIVLSTIVITFVLAMGLFTLTASAATSGYYYYKVSNAEATITGCKTSISGAVTIPSTLGGYPVTSIGGSAFSSCSSLTSITIPDSVTRIGYYAFSGCSSLTSITIPDSVTSIGEYAFYKCSSLTSVTIGNSVTSIGNYAFDGCTGLTSITIGNSVTSIGEYAFYNCSSLTSITIPDSVTSIGEYAFSGCSSLTSITLPFIGNTLDGTSRTRFGSIFGSSYDNSSVPSSLKEVIITKATSIGVRAFEDCDSLTSVTIGNSVTSIGHYAFNGCTGLTSVTIGNSVTSIGEYAFHDCSSLTSITIPNSVKSIGNVAFHSCTSLKNITIPDSVTSIGSGAFSGTAYYNNPSNWKNAVLYINNHLIKAKTSFTGSYAVKEGTKTIADYAFSFCQGLRSVTIPDSVKSIGKEAFERCYNLKSVKVGKGVKSIGKSAFWYCNAIEKITLPFVGATLNDTTNAYFGYIFGASDCFTNNERVPSGLTEVTITNDTRIDDYAFYNCRNITTVKLGSKVSIIGASSFENCSSLKKITMSNNIVMISSSAFKSCSALKTVTLGKNLQTISEYAFYGCSSLESIIVPNSVTSIGEYAFAECTSLKRAAIKGRITYIYGGLFDGCKSLTTLAFPKNVKGIAYNAFNNCKSLKMVYYEGTKTQKNSIGILSGNNYLKNATWSYGKFNTIDHIYLNGCDKTCELCLESRTITHSYKTTTTKATTSKNGKTETKCSVCGNVKSTTTIKYAKTFTLSATSYTYNGSVKTPTVTVKDSAGKVISSSNYTVTYASGRKNAGTYTVKVTMKGNYTGTKTLSFKINPIDISKLKLSISATSYTYNGSVKTPAITVKTASGTKLTKNTHYTVSYASGRKNVGSYTVKVTMKGNYKGTKTFTFKINPVKTTISKVTPATKKLTVTYAKKTTQVTGYEIQYSTSKSFTTKTTKTKTVTKNTTTSASITGLKAKTTYYVRVRTYKTVGGKKYYSGWTTVKSAKTK